MPAKQLELDNIGTVRIFKRRGTRAIRITLDADNTVRVTMPTWLPYAAGIEYIKSKRSWLEINQRNRRVFKHGDTVGKAHHIRFEASAAAVKPSARVIQNEIRITHPLKLLNSDAAVQAAVKRAGLRALKREAQKLLPLRLQQLATTNGYTYRQVNIKRLKSRWGSCNSNKDIALNLFLMQLPWPLIDYVILHELVHTKILNHGNDFWGEFERCLPDAKKLRKILRDHQPALE